jgi:hypothetical protein
MDWIALTSPELRKLWRSVGVNLVQRGMFPKQAVQLPLLCRPYPEFLAMVRHVVVIWTWDGDLSVFFRMRHVLILLIINVLAAELFSICTFSHTHRPRFQRSGS